MNKLIQGIGFNDKKYPAYIGGRATREYTTWHNMLSRYTNTLWVKRDSYTGTTCSENFKSYSFFYEWCQHQQGFRGLDEQGKSWHLDKDLLIKGNKVYSEDTCVFVPSRVNILLNKHSAGRGDSLIGVCLCKKSNKYHARCSVGTTGQKHLGLFVSQEEAFNVYKTFKEQFIKSVADEYKNLIDERAYKALIKYEVCVDD